MNQQLPFYKLMDIREFMTTIESIGIVYRKATIPEDIFVFPNYNLTYSDVNIGSLPQIIGQAPSIQLSNLDVFDDTINNFNFNDRDRGRDNLPPLDQLIALFDNYTRDSDTPGPTKKKQRTDNSFKIIDKNVYYHIDKKRLYINPIDDSNHLILYDDDGTHIYCTTNDPTKYARGSPYLKPSTTVATYNPNTGLPHKINNVNHIHTIIQKARGHSDQYDGFNFRSYLIFKLKCNKYKQIIYNRFNEIITQLRSLYNIIYQIGTQVPPPSVEVKSLLQNLYIFQTANGPNSNKGLYSPLVNQFMNLQYWLENVSSSDILKFWNIYDNQTQPPQQQQQPRLTIDYTSVFIFIYDVCFQQKQTLKLMLYKLFLIYNRINLANAKLAIGSSNPFTKLSREQQKKLYEIINYEKDGYSYDVNNIDYENLSLVQYTLSDMAPIYTYTKNVSNQLIDLNRVKNIIEHSVFYSLISKAAEANAAAAANPDFRTFGTRSPAQLAKEVTDADEAFKAIAYRAGIQPAILAGGKSTTKKFQKIKKRYTKKIHKRTTQKIQKNTHNKSKKNNSKPTPPTKENVNKIYTSNRNNKRITQKIQKNTHNKTKTKS